MRELNENPFGDTLPVLDESFWKHAALVGYSYHAKPLEVLKDQALFTTFFAPKKKGGFEGRVAPGAPFATGTESSRKAVNTKGLGVSLKASTDAYTVVFKTGLYLNFPARQRRAVKWWCDTHLKFLGAKEDSKRLESIVSAINLTPSQTPPPPEASAYIELQQSRLFGREGDKHYVAPPRDKEGAGEGWLKENIMREYYFCLKSCTVVPLGDWRPARLAGQASQALHYFFLNLFGLTQNTPHANTPFQPQRCGDCKLTPSEGL